MFISRGLVGPKTYRNSSTPNQGNRLIFLYRSTKILTLQGRPSGAVAPFKRRNLWRAVMARSRRMRYDESRLHPGAREKGSKRPYQDLTQVPLAEKAKA